MFASVEMISPASATDFTANVLMEKMDAQARAPYIQGVIEGLAFARYLRDNVHTQADHKTIAGMECIYDWYYEKPHTLDMIYVAFDEFPTYTPAAIINSLAKQACGE